MSQNPAPHGFRADDYAETIDVISHLIEENRARIELNKYQQHLTEAEESQSHHSSSATSLPRRQHQQQSQQFQRGSSSDSGVSSSVAGSSNLLGLIEGQQQQHQQQRGSQSEIMMAAVTPRHLGPRERAEMLANQRSSPRPPRAVAPASESQSRASSSSDRAAPSLRTSGNSNRNDNRNASAQSKSPTRSTQHSVLTFVADSGNEDITAAQISKQEKNVNERSAVRNRYKSPPTSEQRRATTPTKKVEARDGVSVAWSRDRPRTKRANATADATTENVDSSSPAARSIRATAKQTQGQQKMRESPARNSTFLPSSKNQPQDGDEKSVVSSRHSHHSHQSHRSTNKKSSPPRNAVAAVGSESSSSNNNNNGSPPRALPCVAHPHYTGHKNCGCLASWHPLRRSPMRDAFHSGLHIEPVAVAHRQQMHHIGVVSAPKLRLVVPYHYHHDVTAQLPTVLTTEQSTGEIWERHCFTGEALSSSPVVSRPDFTISAICCTAGSGSNSVSGPLIWLGSDEGFIHAKSVRDGFTDTAAIHRGSIVSLIEIPKSVRSQVVSDILRDDSHSSSSSTASSTSSSTSASAKNVNMIAEFALVLSASTDGQIRCWGINNSSNNSAAAGKRKLVSFQLASHMAGVRCMALLDISEELHFSRHPVWLLATGGDDGQIRCWDLAELIRTAANTLIFAASASSLTTTAGNELKQQQQSPEKVFYRNHRGIDMEPVFVLKGHQGPVRSICAVRYEKLISKSTNFNSATSATSSSSQIMCPELWTGGQDGTVKVWYVPSFSSPALLKATLHGHANPVVSLMSIKSHSMWSTDQAGHVLVHKVDTLQAIFSGAVDLSSSSSATASGANGKQQQQQQVLQQQQQKLAFFPSLTCIVPVAGHIIWLSSASGTTSALYVPGSLPKSNIDPRDFAALQDSLDQAKDTIHELETVRRFELDEKCAVLQALLESRFDAMENFAKDYSGKVDILIEGYGPNIGAEINTQLASELDEATKQNSLLSSRNAEVETLLAKTLKEHREVVEEDVRLRARMKDATSGYAECKKKLALAESRFMKTRDDLARETSRADRLESERPRLAQAAEESAKAAAEQTKRAVLAEAKGRSLREDLSRANERAGRLEAEKRTHQQLIERLEAQLAEQTHRAVESESKMKQMKEEAKTASEKMTKVEAKCKQLSSSLIESEREKSAAAQNAAETAKKNEALQKQIEQLQAAKSVVDGEKSNLLDLLDRAKKDILAEKGRVVDAESRAESSRVEKEKQRVEFELELDEQRRQMQRELDSTTHRAVEAEKSAHSSAERVRAVEHDMEIWRGDSSAAGQNAIQEMEQMRDENRLAMKELQAELTAAKEELLLKELRTKQLETKLHDVQERLEKQQQQAASGGDSATMEALRDAQRKLEESETESDRLRAQLAIAEHRAKNATNNNERLVTLAESYDSQIAELRKQLQEKNYLSMMNIHSPSSSPREGADQNPNNFAGDDIGNDEAASTKELSASPHSAASCDSLAASLRRRTGKAKPAAVTPTGQTSMEPIPSGGTQQEQNQQQQQQLQQQEAFEQQLERHRQDFEQRLRDLKEELDLLRIDNEELIAQVEEQQNKITELTEELTTTRTQEEEQQHSSQPQQQTSNSRAEQLQQELDQLRQQLSNINNGSASAMKASEHKHQRETASLQEKLRSAEDAQAESKKQVESLKRQLADSHDATQQQLESATGDAATVKSELEEIKKQLGEHQSGEEAIRTQLEYSTKKVVALAADLDVTRKKLEDMTNELDEAKKNASRHRDAARIAGMEKDQTSADLAQAQEQLSASRRLLDKLQEEHKTVSRQCDELRAAVDELRRTESVGSPGTELEFAL